MNFAELALYIYAAGVGAAYVEFKNEITEETAAHWVDKPIAFIMALLWPLLAALVYLVRLILVVRRFIRWIAW